MATTAPKRHWVWRVIRVVVIVEIAYLVLLNLALQTTATQTLINAIKPDKLHVSWERAWTWYPFRVHALGVSVNGQSRSQRGVRIPTGVNRRWRGAPSTDGTGAQRDQFGAGGVNPRCQAATHFH